MGKLKWAKELVKKGGSKIADIQKGTKPKGKKTTKWELEAEENKLAAKKVYQKRKNEGLKKAAIRRKGKEAWQDKKIAKGESAGASDYDKQMKRRVEEQQKQQIVDRQYLKDK